MTVRCLNRPRARVFGFVVEGACIRCLATGSPLNKDHLKFPTKYLCSVGSPSHSTAFRYFATARPALQSQSLLCEVSLSVERRLQDILENGNVILQSSSIPSEQSTREVLQSCEDLAKDLVDVSESPERTSKEERTPASNLLSLDGVENDLAPVSPSTALLAASIRDKAVNRISGHVYDIIRNPNVFITPPLLSIYVNTQSLLGRPETIPQVFILYTSKPIPRPNTSPIQYSTPNPNTFSSAVPVLVANVAMTAAIEKRNLALCLDIINTTVCTTAYQRSKILRKALIPVSTFALAPAAAYALASRLSIYLENMDSDMATNVLFGGTLAYVGFTATIGFVAMTTANDQMDRVTWATGTPLRERWLREEERALTDRVAGALGFQESWRRGEEEGDDWEALREWIGLRGMMLDRVELMEGME
ncbi:hypothetical protein MMC12_002671 [Toensbergia leucococca]|nr:hypothetical protein [Toensbergia leucococca]